MKRPKKKAAKRVRFKARKLTYTTAPKAAAGEVIMTDARGFPIAPEVNGRPYATVRNVTLPELWCAIEVPAHVTILEAMRKDAPVAEPTRKRPAMLVQVIDHDDAGKKKDLALPLRLAALFAVIPKAGYVGRSYRITRHRRHERKNAAGYTVEEISTAESAP